MPDNLDTAFSILQAFQHQYEQMMQHYPAKKQAQFSDNPEADRKADFKQKLRKVKQLVDSTLDRHQQDQSVSCHQLINAMIFLDHGFLDNTLYPEIKKSNLSQCAGTLFRQVRYRDLYTRYMAPVTRTAIAIICKECDTDFAHARQVLLYLGNAKMSDCNYRQQVITNSPDLARNFQTVENKLRSCKNEILKEMHELIGVPALTEIQRKIQQEYARVVTELNALKI